MVIRIRKTSKKGKKNESNKKLYKIKSLKRKRGRGGKAARLERAIKRRTRWGKVRKEREIENLDRGPMKRKEKKRKEEYKLKKMRKRGRGEDCRLIINHTVEEQEEVISIKRKSFLMNIMIETIKRLSTIQIIRKELITLIN